MHTEDSSGLPVNLASLPDGVIAHIMEAVRPGDVIRLSAVFSQCRLRCLTSLLQLQSESG
jgi:hypothetical protein